MTILCFGLTAIGLVMLGKHIMEALLNVNKHVRQHKKGLKKWHWWDVLEVHTQRVPPWCAHPSSRLAAPCSVTQDTLIQLADCLSHNKLMLLMVITAPVIWSDVINLYAPARISPTLAAQALQQHPVLRCRCFECYDFEAVVAHEIGHVLGFGHPDQYFMDNLKRPNADDYKQVPGFEAMSKDAQDKWKAFYAQVRKLPASRPTLLARAEWHLHRPPRSSSVRSQAADSAHDATGRRGKQNGPIDVRGCGSEDTRIPR